MARTKEFNEEEALQAAMVAFWKAGYGATSIQDLEEATGLKRTSLYNAFGDKRELFGLALQRYHASLGFQAALETGRVRDAITALFNEAIKLHFDKGHPGGCLAVLSIMENHQLDAEIRRMLETGNLRLRERIVERLQRGIDDGELRAGIDCRLIANQVMATLTGIIVMAKANIPKKELLAVAEQSAGAFLPELDDSLC